MQQPPRPAPDRQLRWVVCLTYLSLALLYNALTPIGESPDEIGHFEYVRLLADEGRLPGAADALWQGHQAPLYYALQAGWARLIQAATGCRIELAGLPNRPNPGFPNLPDLNSLRHPPAERIAAWTCPVWSYHLLRLLSTALTIPMILLTFGILREALPGAPLMAATAGTIAALLPSHVAVSAMLNNDALANLLIVATTYLVVVAATRGDATALARAALVAVAGTTAKLSGLYLLGLVGVAVLLRRDLLRSLLRDRRARPWLVAAGACAVFPILVLVRNLAEWGDPFGVGALEKNLAKLTAVGANPRPEGILRYYALDMPRLVGDSLLVAYGPVNYPLWEHFTLTWRATQVIVAGALLSALLRGRWRSVARVPLVMLAAGFALFFATYFLPGYRYRWLQVRYFFGQLPLLSLCIAVGLFTLWDLPRRLGLRVPDAVLVALVYAALLALNLLVLAQGVYGHLYRHVGTGG